MDYMVQLKGVTKRFGSFVAVQDVSLDIEGGEFLTLLGPSGCGKTTLLRMISGFETPTEGTVYLSGQDVTHLPPYKRDVNQVFQSYALFPHLTVADNISFGLKMKKVPKAEIEERVKQVTQLVSLTGFEQRKPSQLSGGQRQRVALARAIVCRPRVLLLDEPLAALDAKLRHSMQIELKHLQKKVGITFVFVTHDQEEALTMSDRIAVINLGRIEQLGEVSEIYHSPRTTFVANFIGQANILESTPMAVDANQARVRLNDAIELVVNTSSIPPASKNTLISIRPEKIHLQKTNPGGENTFEARVSEELFKGAVDQLVLTTDSGLELTALVANECATEESFHLGDKVFCYLHPSDIVVVQSESAQADGVFGAVGS